MSYKSFDEDQHVLLNLDIVGSQQFGSFTNAVYSVTKDQPIVANPSRYHLFVQRFDVPGYNFPQIIFDPADPGVVTVEYNGDVQTQALVWVPFGPSLITDPDYYFVYNPGQYLQMVNTALQTAFTALAAPPAGAVAPRVIFNEALGKFQFLAQNAFYEDNLALPISVRFDAGLFLYFPFWNYDASTSTVNQRIVIQDQLYNRINYVQPPAVPAANDIYLTVTDYSSVANFWMPISSLYFTTNIPVRNSYTDLGSPNPNQSSSVSQPILVDFKINVNNLGDHQSDILFIPQTSIGIIDLIANDPLKKISLEIRWQDWKGRTYPLQLAYGFRASVSLLLVRKGSAGIA